MQPFMGKAEGEKGERTEGQTGRTQADVKRWTNKGVGPIAAKGFRRTK